MICERCSISMSMGAPHCETIKIQYECDCGNIQCEYYTREEQTLNELVVATQANYQLCRQALEKHNYNLEKARREIEEVEFNKLCQVYGADADEFAQSIYQQNVADLDDPSLVFLTMDIISRIQNEQSRLKVFTNNN